MMRRFECIVSGRVRGVMYRDSACRRARALGLTGFVQNEPDNTVRVVAEGEEGALKEFLTFVWKGSPLSKVERVEKMWGEATGEFIDFHIRFRNFLDRF